MARVRVHRLLAAAGIASRRGAEALIQAGRVSVNGVPVREPGAQADPEADRIEVDGRPLPRAEPRHYLLLHKPRGYLTTRDDPQGRPRVFDLLPDLGVRLHTVGRLDFDAEGLLLLTNDGAVTQRLSHPRHGVGRVYEALVAGRVDARTLAALRRGVVLEDGPARVARAVRLRPGGGGRWWLSLTVAEGRYHEVKRICRAVGLEVQRLVRVAFGPIELGDLPVGAWRPLSPREVSLLQALVVGGPACAGKGPPIH